jgi:hypothetical protein
MHAGWPTLVAVLTLAARASVGRAAELDVQGNWQLNVDCGYSATGTSFLAIDQAPGGRAITASPTTCGSFEVPGAIRRIASCTSTPAIYDGSIVEDAVTLPDGEGWHVDFSVARNVDIQPVCTGVHRIEFQNRLVGRVREESGGQATSIAGTLQLGAVTLLTAGDLPCYHLDDGPDCQFELRRNDLGVGTNVTVSPRAGTSVTFEQVLSPGVVGVTPLTDPDAEVPARFAVMGAGNVQLYYDVHTTATVAGAIETCFSYPDANDDGAVDGISPPLDEDELVVLHSEAGAFIDRTERVDTVRKIVCARTTSLSQMTVAMPSGARPSDSTASLYRLRMDRGRRGRERLEFTSSPMFTGFPIGTVDPRRRGAVLEVFSTTETLAARFELAAPGWTASRNGKRFRFAGNVGPHGRRLSATIGGKARITAAAVGLALVRPPTALAWRLSIGDRRWCNATTNDFKENRPNHLRAASPPYDWETGVYSPLVDCADKRIAWLLRTFAR